MEAVVVVLLVGLSFWAASAAGPPLPSPPVQHVTFVDTSLDKRNFLFRGGDPNVGPHGSFDYAALVQSIELAATRAGVQDLPDKFYLVDINLTNLEANSDAKGSIAEWTFFNANPHLGRFLFWETHGTNDNASNLGIPAGLKQSMVENFQVWQGDQLVTRMEQLHSLLNTNMSLPVIIYGHCYCGCDRTGETMGAYYMKWLRYTWEMTNKVNTMIAERPMTCSEYLAMQWYCLYLNYSEGTDLNCMNNQPCTVL